MSEKIKRAELVSILNAVNIGLAGKGIVEQTDKFIFFDDRVCTYNDQISISHPISGVDVSGAVQAKELNSLLSRMNDEEITIKMVDGELTISGLKSKAGIRLEEKSEVIDDVLEKMGSPKEWFPVPEKLNEAIRACVFSAGRDLSKPLLTNLFFIDNFCYGSDNLRASRFKLDRKFDHPLLIPATAAKDLLDYKPKSYGFTLGWVHFEMEDGVIFSCRVMEGNYPHERIDEIINSIKTKQIVKLPGDMKDILGRAGIFSAPREVRSDADNRVTVIFTPGRMTIKGEGDAGWFEETARVVYDWEEVEFDANPELLEDILSHTEEMAIGKSILKFDTPSFVHVVSRMSPKKKKG